MKMKEQILISLIILSSNLSLNAQIYSPSGTIQGASGNNNFGIGATSPEVPLTVYGVSNIYPHRTGGGDARLFSINYTLSSPSFLNNDYPIVLSTGGGNQPLIFDAARIGVGTTNPSAKFEINGNFKAVSTNGYIIIDNVNSGENYYNASVKHVFQGGNVGIGTNSPEAPLTIYGISNIYPRRTGGGDVRLFSVNYTLSNPSFISNDYPVVLSTGGGNQPLILDGARIGIGTTNPSCRLDVCGTIRANEVKVDLIGGCDFVFKNNYKLMDLKELENFVKTNQHLPEIASEKEMVENGVNMKELQMKLLQKIEELTLYTIEQNKAIEELKQVVKVQNEKIEKIESASK